MYLLDELSLQDIYHVSAKYHQLALENVAGHAVHHAFCKVDADQFIAV